MGYENKKQTPNKVQRKQSKTEQAITMSTTQNIWVI